MSTISLTAEEAQVALDSMTIYMLNHVSFNQVTPAMRSLIDKLRADLEASVEVEVVEVVEAPAEEAPAAE
jgi:hypothetical protein